MTEFSDQEVSGVARTLCRDCAATVPAGERRCSSCGSPRLISHPELMGLSIAHIDCDAFYASVEKRDNPELTNKPVIVGGGRRGVVSACCYIARTRGVHSAMPMFQALKACPDAAVIRPNMEKYQRIGGEIKAMMRDTTPAVESISIDEAFLDLGGTETLHHGSPAQTLIKLIKRIETETGVTASVGLSYNKFLAKMASDLDKPRGFAIIGRTEAIAFLTPRPVSAIWGVGKSLCQRLDRDGLKTIGQLRRLDERELVARYGKIGARLAHLSRGEDNRRVGEGRATKSISSETTFAQDIRDADRLERRLWPLCEEVARRLKKQGLAAGGITLKMKTSKFRIITRSRQLDQPTQLAQILFDAATPLVKELADGPSYRLIGIGAAKLCDADAADRPSLIDTRVQSISRVESAIDMVRMKFGTPAIRRGRSLIKD